MNKWTAQADRICDVIDTQTAYILLRRSLLCSFGFYARCIKPSILRPFAYAFDNLIIKSMKRILDISDYIPDASAPLNIEAIINSNDAIKLGWCIREQLQLPVHEGGFGIYSVEKSLFYSYFGSIQLCYPHLCAIQVIADDVKKFKSKMISIRHDWCKTMMNKPIEDPLLNPNTLLSSWLEAREKCIMVCKGEFKTAKAYLDLKEDKFVAFKTQAFFTKLENNRNFKIDAKSLLWNVVGSELRRSMMNNTSGSIAHRWLQTSIPYDYGKYHENTKFQNKHFKTQAKTRLGLQHSCLVDATCSGINCTKFFDFFGIHSYTCKYGSRIKVHDIISKILWQCAKDAGLGSSYDKDYDTCFKGLLNDNKIPDVYAVDDDNKYILDVKIIHPGNYLQQCDLKGKAIEMGASQKATYYKNSIRDGYKFVPFVLSNTGSLCVEGQKFLGILAKAYCKNLKDNLGEHAKSIEKSFLQNCYTKISCALHKSLAENLHSNHKNIYNTTYVNPELNKTISQLEIENGKDD